MRSNRLRFLLAAFALAASALAIVGHPANIPTARVHLDENRCITIKVRFDNLAFCLDETPRDASDAAMNALLDGSESKLQARLDDAKERFKASFKLVANNGPVPINKLTFPTAKEVLKRAQEGGRQRLPVMLSVTVSAKLPVSAKTFSCRFPEVLDAVVVTAELPYEEAISEQLKPGAASSAWTIPSAEQIAKAKREAVRANGKAKS